MKKVSIIIPIYNGAKHIRHCVESVLNQDYPALELILVDDGSKDESWTLMQAYAKQDARVKAIHKENGGVSSTRNCALSEADGTYIRFVDVDDWLPMDSTKLLVREMENASADLVIGDFYRVVDGNVSQKGSIEKSGVLSRKDYADEMLLSPADLYYGVLWNKLYKREIIEKYALRMKEDISYSEDMIFNLEYLPHTDRIAVLKAPVYYYEYTKGSLLDQSMNLGSTVKMKANVIGYYNEFYKNTFDSLGYQERLPVIYAFLLSFGKDSLAIPFLPGTKKLGSETGKPLYLNRMPGLSPFENAYLTDRLLEYYLDTLAKRHRMECEDFQVLYYLEKTRKSCSAEEIAAFTGLSRMAVIVSLSRLRAKQMVLPEENTLIKSVDNRFIYHAPELTEEFRQMERDFAEISCSGISEEELRDYQRCQNKINANIRNHLTPVAQMV